MGKKKANHGRLCLWKRLNSTDNPLFTGIMLNRTPATGSHTETRNWVSVVDAGKTIFPDGCYQNAKARVSFSSAKYPVTASPLCIMAGSWIDKENFDWENNPMPTFQDVWKALYDAGINFIDTGDACHNGESEAIVRQLVRGLPRDSLVIQAKYLSPPLNKTNLINLRYAPIASLSKRLKHLVEFHLALHKLNTPSFNGFRPS
ncbi:hypothetical protein B0J13DRAFT_530345 [Dactylonectria estremocensis]|uniref:NADP-dependent oxidoreductase domain-containing protein n=1 Tax=Dactylonectria estremocensis TaxID=1079267 RepID=A0A9P9E2S2_9HYPO|nr:hypothetical protein B0J13DRAFT_530345 [Dactylonectria estremocensis]